MGSQSRGVAAGGQSGLQTSKVHAGKALKWRFTSSKAWRVDGKLRISQRPVKST